MITNLQTYVIGSLIHEIFEKDIELSGKKLSMYNLTHMMSMTNLVAFGVEILRIYSRCSLEKEFIKLICMKS